MRITSKTSKKLPNSGYFGSFRIFLKKECENKPSEMAKMCSPNRELWELLQKDELALVERDRKA
jgi:hypothetical protein